MTMIMNKETNGLFSLIAVSLRQGQLKDIELSEDRLLSIGLSKEGLDLAMQALEARGIITRKVVKFSSGLTASSSEAKFVSTATPIYNKPVYILNIDLEKFEAVAPAEFSDDDATITIGSKVVHLPRAKNEHYFCRAIFKESVNKAVDWDVIYEEITGNSNYEDAAKAKRSVYDTYEKINNRLKEEASIEGLFIWETRTIIRTR